MTHDNKHTEELDAKLSQAVPLDHALQMRLTNIQMSLEREMCRADSPDDKRALYRMAAQVQSFALQKLTTSQDYLQFIRDEGDFVRQTLAD